MDLREFVYVLAVVDCGGITRAAEALFVSQPSLSIYIKNLENRLGIHIFERTGGRLSLTPEGKVYVEYARQIVRLDHELQRHFSNMKNLEEGRVRVGITINKAQFLLPRLLPQLRRDHPHLYIEFVEDNSKNLEERVMQRDLDFILINHPFRAYDLEFLCLFDEEFMVALPSVSPWCASAQPRANLRYPWLDIELLRDEYFILAKPGQKLRQIADYLFLKHNIRPKILLETVNMATACELTSAGMGVSFTLDTYIGSVAPSAQAMRLFSVGEASVMVNRFVIAFPPNCHLSSAAQATIDSLRRHLTLEQVTR